MNFIAEIVRIVVRVDVLLPDIVLNECTLACRLIHKPEAWVANLVMSRLEEIDSLGRESVLVDTRLESHVCFLLRHV